MAYSPLTLTDEQLEQLRADTDGGTANPLKGYQDIVSFIAQANSTGTNTLSPDSTFWYQQAITINGNDMTSFGNIFIHAATAYGSHWDGGSVTFQPLSDAIAGSVIQDTLKSGSLQQISTMLHDDIEASLNIGHMTLGGWGGSFYYWNTPYDGKITVGQQILANPQEYDKFVATTANALCVTGNQVIEQLGLSVQSGSLPVLIDNFVNALNVGVPTLVNSSCPLNVKADIIARAVDVEFFGGSAAGNPNMIDGYVYLGKDLFGHSQWVPTVGVITSPVHLSLKDGWITNQLDTLRATRIAQQDTRSGDGATNIYEAIAQSTHSLIPVPSELQKPDGTYMELPDQPYPQPFNPGKDANDHNDLVNAVISKLGNSTPQASARALSANVMTDFLSASSQAAKPAAVAAAQAAPSPEWTAPAAGQDTQTAAAAVLATPLSNAQSAQHTVLPTEHHGLFSHAA